MHIACSKLYHVNKPLEKFTVSLNIKLSEAVYPVTVHCPYNDQEYPRN